MQGGGDSTNQDGGESQVQPELPREEPPVRLGRNRVWNRPVPSGAPDEPQAADGDSGAEATLGAASESTVVQAPAGPAPAMELSPIFRNWSDPAASGNTPERCRFLRAISDNGRLIDPQPEAVATHRCAAFGEPLPLSLRQQELVCLQRVHVSCPRYLRGALLASESTVDPEPVKARSGISRLTAAGLVLVLLAALVGGAAASGFVPGLGSGSSRSPDYAVATNQGSATASSGTSTGAIQQPTISPSPTVAATPTPTEVPTPSPTPEPTAAPSPTPWPACPPGAKGGRMVCLVPCPDASSCYEYMVHAGDKLNEIAYYFGVTMKSIWAMNPWLHESTTIAAGEILRLPPPTK